MVLKLQSGLIILVKHNTLILYSYFHWTFMFFFIGECDVLPMHRKKVQQIIFFHISQILWKSC